MNSHRYRKDAWTGVLASLLILAGCFFMLRDLGKESYWLDEIFSLKIITQNIPEMLKTAGYGTVPNDHPPLYFLLAHAWVGIFGSGETGLRSLSVLFGVSSLVMLYLLGRRLFGDMAALIALTIASFSPFIIQYSQEARPYSLFLFLTLTSAYFFIRLYQENAARLVSRIGLTVSCGLLLYTHAMAVFIVFGFIVCLFVARKMNRIFFKAGMKSVLISLAAFIPWSYFYFYQLATRKKALNWITYYGIPWQNWGVTIKTSFMNYVGEELLFWLTAVFAVLGIARLFLKKRTDPTSIILILSLLIFPHAFPLLVSSFLQPMYLTRITIPAAAAFFLLAGYGYSGVFDRDGLKWASRGIAVIFVFSAAFVQINNLSANYYSVTKNEEWRAVAREITLAEDKKDAILISDIETMDCFTHYYKGNLPVYGQDRNSVFDESKCALLRGAVPERGRLWLILSHVQELDPEINEICRALRKSGFKTFFSKDYTGITVVLFEMPKRKRSL